MSDIIDFILRHDPLVSKSGSSVHINFDLRDGDLARKFYELLMDEIELAVEDADA